MERPARGHYADQSQAAARAPRGVLYNTHAQEYITRQLSKGFLQTYLLFVIVKRGD